MKHLLVTVTGDPVPQGSKSAYIVNGRAVLVEASKKLKPWRQQIKSAAESAMLDARWTTVDEPCRVHISFLMSRPVSAKREWHTVKPDLDKLVRAVLDGLTDAGIWRDDSRVIALSASKAYAKDTPGVVVTVTRGATDED